MVKPAKLPSGITKRVRKRTKADGTTVTYPPTYRVRVTWTRPDSDGLGGSVTSREELGDFSTLRDAKEALGAAQTDMNRGVFIPPAEMRRRAKTARETAKKKAERDSLTVAVWAAKWLQILSTEEPPRSPSTIMSYTSTLRCHVIPQIGDVPLAKVTTEQINDVIATAGEGGKKGAARNVARCLRAMFSVAVDRHVGGIINSPVKLKGTATASPRRPDDEVPDLNQVRALINGAPGDIGLGVQLAAGCALRLGEVLGLQRGDFQDLDKPGEATINVRRQFLSKGTRYAPPKYNSYRQVPLPDYLVPIVDAHLDEYALPGDDAPVIVSPVDSSRCMSHKALAARWGRAKATAVAAEGKAGRTMPDFDFHALRHFALTEYGRTGATLVDLARYGGHKDLETVARYQHSNLDRSRQLAASLPDLTASE